MKHLKLLAASLGVFMLLAAGCAGKTENKEVTTVTVTPETITLTQEETNADAKNSSEQNQINAVLEEKKDSMIIVNSEDNGESYVFLIEDESLVKDLQTGDSITITYEGDIIENFDNLIARAIEKK